MLLEISYVAAPGDGRTPSIRQPPPPLIQVIVQGALYRATQLLKESGTSQTPVVQPNGGPGGWEIGSGTWCIENGWGQAWTATLLDMRQQGTAVSDFTAQTRAGASSQD